MSVRSLNPLSRGLLLCLLAFLLPAFVPPSARAAAAPAIKWQKTFGGSLHDAARFVEETSDGGLIVTGFSNYDEVGDKSDILLVKTDANGVPAWQKDFSGTYESKAYCVKEAADGGYVLAGEKMLSDGTTDAYLLKTTSGGEVDWSKTFGGTGSDKAYSVARTDDGGYVLAGEKMLPDQTTDAFLVKTDSQGSLSWQKTFGGEGSEWAASVQQTSDKGYILGGYTNSDEEKGNDAYLVKTDKGGGLSWQKSFGSTGSNWIESARQTPDGGYVLAGGSDDKACIAKAGASGNIVWSKTFSGANGGWAFSASRTRAGNYISTGYFQTATGRNEAFLLKLNSSGTLLWDKTFGGSGFSTGHCGLQTRDAGYVVAGYTNSVGAGLNDAYLVKFDSDGELPLPTITAITPDVAPRGGEIAITGYSFGAAKGTSSVAFNSKKASSTDYIAWSDAGIRMKVPAGAASGWVVVTTKYGASNAFPFTVSAPAGKISDTWYLPEGSSAWGFDTYVTILNPNATAVTAAVVYMTAGGPRSRADITLPANSQTVVNPRNDIGAADFSTRVTCREGKPIVADRRMLWTGKGALSQEGHSSVGVTSPSKTWYLAEGSSKWGFETWLLIQNPNAQEATCELTYMIEGMHARKVVKKVPAFSRSSFNIADDLGAVDTSIEVESQLPVISERSMYRNNRRGGHDSIGVTAPSNDFYLAEGTTAWGFTSYILVQNPNSKLMDVNITYMTPTGPRKQSTFEIPANARKTLRVNDFLRDQDFSAYVHGSLPIIAERAMYWDNGTGEACHDSVGMPAPHEAFYFPDGETTNGHETWTLVQNPNDSAVEIEISYLTPTGEGNRAITAQVPANSRKSYFMADMIRDGRAAIVVISKTPGLKIFAERAMYWDNRGAGTNSIGAWAD